MVIDDSNMFGYHQEALLSLSELIALGNEVSKDDFVRRRLAVRPDDPATIVYTSGTSAHPKGALYTHRALITLGNQFHAFPELNNARDVRQRRAPSVQSSRTSALTRRKECWSRASSRISVMTRNVFSRRYTKSRRSITRQSRAYWSKLASRVIVGIENSSALKRAAYHAAMKVGQAYRRRRWNGRKPLVLGAFYASRSLLSSIVC